MKFFEKYLNLDSLKNNPFRWLIAFLSSPVYYAEKHYQKVYHLNFIHARKLWIFDMTLLISILISAVFGLFWWTYDPTITDLIYVNIDQQETRIKSGDYVNYKVNYKNDSTVKIENPILKIDLPEGFVFDKTDYDSFDSEKKEFYLKELDPNENDYFSFSGWFYGTPHEDHFIHLNLSYNQENKKRQEEKNVPIITIPRGSVLEMELIAQDNILYRKNTPITYKIKNTGELAIKNIEIPLETEYFYVSNNSNIINIDLLKSGEEMNFDATLHLKETGAMKNIDYSILASLEINNKKINQEKISHNFTIIHPEIEIENTWENNLEKIKPANNIKLNIKITNTGDVRLNNLEISLPIDTSIINTNKILNLNENSSYNNKIFKISKIAQLDINEEKNIEIIIPILDYPLGTDIKLIMTPIIRSEIADNPNIFEKESQSSEIKIGTSVIFSQSLNYYTNEGDQIGRGPNPPELDKESKYWVFIEIENNSSRIKDLNLKSKLANNISFTGKTSVTKGDNLFFNEKNKEISWQLQTLNPHEKAGVYFEIAFSPKTIDELSNFKVLENTSLSSFDTYIETQLEFFEKELKLQ